MSKLLYENGIHYSLESQAGFVKVGYTLIHIPTNERFRRFVYVHGLANIDSLLMHWNRFAQWKVERAIA